MSGGKGRFGFVRGPLVGRDIDLDVVPSSVLDMIRYEEVDAALSLESFVHRVKDSPVAVVPAGAFDEDDVTVGDAVTGHHRTFHGEDAERGDILQVDLVHAGGVDVVRVRLLGYGVVDRRDGIVGDEGPVTFGAVGGDADGDVGGEGEDGREERDDDVLFHGNSFLDDYVRGEHLPLEAQEKWPAGPTKPRSAWKASAAGCPWGTACRLLRATEDEKIWKISVREDIFDEMQQVVGSPELDPVDQGFCLVILISPEVTLGKVFTELDEDFPLGLSFLP